MSIKHHFILASALLASLAYAQAQVGTVGNVQGLVTDTDGASVSSTTPGERIVDGERFVTSSNGSVTLQLNNGCTLTLQPNQAVTIDSRMTCRELTAAVTPVGGPPGAPGFAGTKAGGLIGVAALTAGFFVVDRAMDKNPNVSGQ